MRLPLLTSTRSTVTVQSVTTFVAYGSSVAIVLPSSILLLIVILLMFTIHQSFLHHILRLRYNKLLRIRAAQTVLKEGESRGGGTVEVKEAPKEIDPPQLDDDQIVSVMSIYYFPLSIII